MIYDHTWRWRNNGGARSYGRGIIIPRQGDTRLTATRVEVWVAWPHKIGEFLPYPIYKCILTEEHGFWLHERWSHDGLVNDYRERGQGRGGRKLRRVLNSMPRNFYLSPLVSCTSPYKTGSIPRRPLFLHVISSSSSYRPASVYWWHVHSRSLVFHTLNIGQRDTRLFPLIS